MASTLTPFYLSISININLYDILFLTYSYAIIPAYSFESDNSWSEINKVNFTPNPSLVFAIKGALNFKLGLKCPFSRAWLIKLLWTEAIDEG